MMECTQSTPYKLDTASSKPNILHASIVDTADIPRDAVQFGVKVSRVKVGKVDVEGRGRRRGREGGPRPRQLLLRVPSKR